jgi:PRTRC genetic system protein B
MPVRGFLPKGEQLKCNRALLIYEGSNTALATVHGVHNDGEKMALTAGELLSRPALENLVRTLEATPSRRTVSPDHVLCSDGGLLAWFVPSERRPIYFSTSNSKFNKEMSGKIVCHPSLLFLARPGRLYVFALANSERPRNDTPIYYAPYFNLYATGAMCRGNAPYPDNLATSGIPQWERAFFDTHYTHSNYRIKFLNYSSHDALWREMVGAERFPWSYLEPIQGAESPVTVEDILNHDETD